MDDLGCRLPYNQPGVPDFLQLRERRPTFQPLLMPPRLREPASTSTCAAAAPRRALLIWRQSFPFNYMEFIRRVLGEAPTLLSLVRSRQGIDGTGSTTALADASSALSGPIIHVPLDRNISLPAYYHAVLGVPLGGTVLNRSPSSWLDDVAAGSGGGLGGGGGGGGGSDAFQRRAARGSLFAHSPPAGASMGFSSATLCCVRKPTKINATAAIALLQQILHAHKAADKAADKGLPTTSPGFHADGRPRTWEPTPDAPPVDVLLIARTPPAWAGTTNGRRITNADALLAGCRRSGRTCESIDFGALPFGAALRRVRSARALVGVHGAGLANAVFLPPSSVAVELMPRGFAASANSFGGTKFGFLPALGVRHVRLFSKESDARCVERARRVAEKLRDCDVTAEWPAIDEALGGFGR